MSVPFRFLVSFILLFLIAGCDQKTKTPKTEQTIDSLLKGYHAEGKFNGSVLVMKKGKEMHHQSYGYSDGSKETLLTNDHRYGIGSIYKEFPAVAIMQLQEKNLIQLEDKVIQHLPKLPSWAAQISIKNLLQYTSGLPRVDFNKYFSKNEVLKDQDIWNDLLKLEQLEFEPSTDYLYSNNNPYLLIKIIENVTDQSFLVYAKKELFIPFDLNQTVLKDQYPYLDKTLMASPFNEVFKEDQYKVSTPTILFSSTTKDLYTWFLKLNSFEIINEASVKLIAATADLKNENMQAPLGNCIFQDDKIIEHYHHGSVGNFEGLVKRYNQKNLTIVILTNQKNQNVFDISEAIYAMVSELN